MWRKPCAAHGWAAILAVALLSQNAAALRVHGVTQCVAPLASTWRPSPTILAATSKKKRNRKRTPKTTSTPRAPASADGDAAATAEETASGPDLAAGPPPPMDTTALAPGPPMDTTPLAPGPPMDTTPLAPPPPMDTTPLAPRSGAEERPAEDDVVQGERVRIELPPLPEELGFDATGVRRSAAKPQLERPLTELFPVPSETIKASSPESSTTEAQGAVVLPTLEELAAEKSAKATKKGGRRRKAGKEAAATKKTIDRADTAAYTRALEVDPNADTNLDLFEETQDVDFFASILGEGADKFFGIESAYLQIGHAALALTLLVCATVVDPNFPLTNVPAEYRGFLAQGLVVVYLVNAGVAALAFQEARARQQPALFWTIKAFFLGGVALNQLRTSPKFDPRRGSSLRK